MHCPVCRSKETKVVDSRISQGGMTIRRRRECEKCHYRFSTLEEAELLGFVVIKNDGKRESYSREKLEKGIIHSLTKRSFTQDKFQSLIHSIERDIQKKPAKAWKQNGTKNREIMSKDIGDIIMKHLKKFDKVAYIRFASIYRAFEDVKKFETEVRSLLPKNKNKKRLKKD